LWERTEVVEGLQRGGGRVGRVIEGSEEGWMWNEEVLEDEDEALRAEEEEEEAREAAAGWEGGREERAEVEATG